MLSSPTIPSPDAKTDLLLHLLAHRAHQTRFEMDKFVTEFAIMKAFRWMGPHKIRSALQDLETRRLVTRQTQYVVGYNEPKVLYLLTPAGRLFSKRVIAGDGKHETH
jgi:hypothetical protein